MVTDRGFAKLRKPGTTSSPSHPPTGSRYPSPPGIALAQQAQKPPESRIVVGSPPIGDIVDQGWFVVAIDLTVDDARVLRSGPAFVQQADALSGAYHAQDVFAAAAARPNRCLVASGA